MRQSEHMDAFDKQQNYIDHLLSLDSIRHHEMISKINILRQNIYSKKLTKHSRPTKKFHPSFNANRNQPEKNSHSQEEKQNSFNHENINRYSQNASPKNTVFQFLPCKNHHHLPNCKHQHKQSCLPTKKIKTLKQKTTGSSPQKKEKSVDFYSLPKEQGPPRSFPAVKDRQSLLRKNALFLLSFIKMREKKDRKGPYVGQCPIKFENKAHKMKFSNYQEKGKKYIESINMMKGIKRKKRTEVSFNLEPW